MSEIEKAIEILKQSNELLNEHIEEIMKKSFNPKFPIDGYEILDKCKGEYDSVELAIETLKEKQEREKGCEYNQIDDDGNVWKCSHCNDELVLISGTPKENEMYFCPSCGFPIVKETEEGENDG